MSDALPQGLAPWIYDIRETRDRVRRIEDRLDKISDADKALERLLDASPEGSWQARALDAERELAKAAKRIVELEQRNALLGERPMQILEARIKDLEAQLEEHKQLAYERSERD